VTLPDNYKGIIWVTVPLSHTVLAYSLSHADNFNTTGVVLNEKGTAATGVTYNTVAHFLSLYYWNLDKNVSPDDPIHRCLQWTKLSNAVSVVITCCQCI